MTDWNYADVWETVADQIPTRRLSCRATGGSPGRRWTSRADGDRGVSCSISGSANRTRWRTT